MLKTRADANRADPLLALISGGGKSEWISEGIVVAPHFGCSGDNAAYEDYPLLGEITEYGALGKFGDFAPYGVCDDYQQILDQCSEIEAEPDREFFIRLTPVRREDQERQGGWRWHKWGEYIGTHKPEHEYLYDEKGIDIVYCFHIFERKQS